MIALQVILLSVINWLVFLCFGILLIFLSMYSSITERTREIGILRSLGASKFFVAALVIKETLVISLIGILIGFAVVLAVTHTVALDRIIWMTSVAISLVVSGIAGSLLAALRAAGRVQIEALDYE
jgi:putative ABC transport system permease protein